MTGLLLYAFYKVNGLRGFHYYGKVKMSPIMKKNNQKTKGLNVAGKKD